RSLGSELPASCDGSRARSVGSPREAGNAQASPSTEPSGDTGARELRPPSLAGLRALLPLLRLVPRSPRKKRRNQTRRRASLRLRRTILPEPLRRGTPRADLAH